MSAYLLDINVLIALFDRAHVDHQAAHRWFAERGRHAWATCPITENGFVRVLTTPAYPNIEATPAQVLSHLRGLIANQPAHEFWPDDASLTDTSLFRPECVQGHKQLTDVYLLGLCQRHQGKLATLDRRITTAAIAGATTTLLECIQA